MKNPIPLNEKERLAALGNYQILDTLPEEQFDRLTKLASLICEAPISLISLIDEKRQWFKSRVGLDAQETPRDISFCQHAIIKDELFEIEDATKDLRFINNPLVTGQPDIRFYAGQPLIDAAGFALGTLCVIDRIPKKLNEKQKQTLAILSKEIVSLIVLRKKDHERDKLENLFNMSMDMICIAGMDGFFKKVNPSFSRSLGWTIDELLSKPFYNFIHPEDVTLTMNEIGKLTKGEKTIGFENRFIKKNGEYVLLSWVANPDPVSGELYAIARDITKEKIAEENLLKTSQLQNAILNSTDYSIISTTVGGIITQFNEGAEKMLGYAKEEIETLTSPAIFHDLNEIVEKAKTLSEELNSVIEPGFEVFVAKAKSGESDTNEWTYIRKDGYRFLVELTVTALKNNSGDITGYLGIAKDISEQKKNENSIKFYEDIVNNMKAGLFVFEMTNSEAPLEFRLVSTNPASCEYIGYDVAHLIGKTLKDIFPSPNGVTEIPEILKKTIVNKKAINIGEFQYGGERVNPGYFSFTSFPLPGNMVGVLFDNITDRKKHEQALSLSEEKYRGFFENSQGLMSTHDLKGNFLSMNSAGASSIGYSVEEVSHKNLSDLTPSYAKTLIQNYLDEIEKYGYSKGLMKMVHKNGTLRTLMYNNVVSIQPDGNKFVIGTAVDITERIILEKQLKENQEKLQTSHSELAQFKIALDAFAIVQIINTDGNFIFVNDNVVKATGYSREELIGQNPRLLNSGYHSKEFFKEIWDTIIDGRIWKGEIRNKAKDGSLYWLDTVIVPFLDISGKPFQYMCIRSEITNRKLAEEKLKEYLYQIEQKNKELDQFSYIVSHDLKAPLRAINNLAEWISEDLKEVPEEVSKHITTMRGRVQRMEGMINGILEYSKIGRKKLPIEDVDINLLLKQVIDSLAIPESFKINIQDNLPILRAENILIYQIFSNLLSNAIKYNDKAQGIIDIGFEEDNKNYTFSVKDNGPGIMPEFFDKIFGMFQTIEARDVRESTGIGLALVKKIIDEKDGKIWIVSDGKNGSEFKFSLSK